MRSFRTTLPSLENNAFSARVGKKKYRHLSAEGSGPPGRPLQPKPTASQAGSLVYIIVKKVLSAEGSGPPGQRTSRAADLSGEPVCHSLGEAEFSITPG